MYNLPIEQDQKMFDYLKPHLMELHHKGYQAFQIAEVLTRQNIACPLGRPWTGQIVKRALRAIMRNTKQRHYLNRGGLSTTASYHHDSVIDEIGAHAYDNNNKP